MDRASGDFDRFCAAARAFRTRLEIELSEVPAPQRLAPFAIAFSVDVGIDEEDLGTGRFVLLHDPVGQEAWGGQFRCVTFIRSAVDPEVANDPMLADVAWSWVAEGLDSAGAAFANSSGTVTRAASKSFGGLAGDGDDSEVEIRASWTPIDSGELMSHLVGWIALIELAVGLTPIDEGVSAIKKRR